MFSDHKKDTIKNGMFTIIWSGCSKGEGEVCVVLIMCGDYDLIINGEMKA